MAYVLPKFVFELLYKRNTISNVALRVIVEHVVNIARVQILVILL